MFQAKREQMAHIPIRRNSSTRPNREREQTRTGPGADGRSSQRRAPFASQRSSWRTGGASRAGAAERGGGFPCPMGKHRFQRYPADRGTPNQCRSRRERNGCRRLGRWRQTSSCFRPSRQQRRNVYIKGVNRVQCVGEYTQLAASPPADAELDMFACRMCRRD